MTKEQTELVKRATSIIAWVEAGGMPSDSQLLALAAVQGHFRRNSTAEVRAKLATLHVTYELHVADNRIK